MVVGLEPWARRWRLVSAGFFMVSDPMAKVLLIFSHGIYKRMELVLEKIDVVLGFNRMSFFIDHMSIWHDHLLFFARMMM